MLFRKIIFTEDGSPTIYLPDWDEAYHSRRGAVQEAYHVFIQNGLQSIAQNFPIHILEIGFGTGLNALISCIESLKNNFSIKYTALEKYPVASEEWKQISFSENIKSFDSEILISETEIDRIYHALMESSWNEFTFVSRQFELKKNQTDFLNFDYPEDRFDVVYFDAFSPVIQPELWTEELFSVIYNSMRINAVLSTYSAKGSVRRAMLAAGFEVEKRPGPPGKREMLVARKNKK
ncbi:MAG: tRNA (5-methylaminomethyl-2-thiouridine)(34)-methyltransferase MnmD [Weeksellaceae bacterium]